MDSGDSQLLLVINTLFNADDTNIPIQGIQQIGYDEGLRLHAYQDEFGNWTIGFGHTPATPGEVWTFKQAYDALIDDLHIDGITPINQNFPWSKSLGVIRHWVLVNMSYNMGINRFKAFTDTLSNMQSGNIPGVLLGMKQSDWYNEVTTRARQLMYQYMTNAWQIKPLSSKQDLVLHNYMMTNNI